METNLIEKCKITKLTDEELQRYYDLAEKFYNNNQPMGWKVSAEKIEENGKTSGVTITMKPTLTVLGEINLTRFNLDK